MHLNIDKFKEIKSTQLQDCTICLGACSRPVRCKGSCRKLFCLKCAIKAKGVKNQCPNRCSKPFELQFIESNIKSFVCPYDPQNCNITISTQVHLKKHHEVCLFIKPQKRLSQSFKINYKCQKGHKLIFLSSEALQKLYGPQSFSQGEKQRCDGCNQQRLSRSLCLSCSTIDKKMLYCFQCRFPPCSKTLCPMGHKITSRKQFNKSILCDFCDVSIKLLNSRVHGFCKCDFHLCDNCYNKLPNNHELIPILYDLNDIQRLSTFRQVQDESQWLQSDQN